MNEREKFFDPHNDARTNAQAIRTRAMLGRLAKKANLILPLFIYARAECNLL